MNGSEVRFCPQCGAGDVATKDIMRNHIIELYCPRCGLITVLVWVEHEVIGHVAAHDPDSDSESW